MGFDLIVRFLVGGLFVSLFATTGELFKPKTFSGLFGAAPSVAVASLLLTAFKRGTATVSIEAHAMIAGALALLFYSAFTAFVSQDSRVPEWLGAGLGWLVWFAFAALGYGALTMLS